MAKKPSSASASASSFAQMFFIIKFALAFLWKTDKKAFLLVVFLNSVASFIIIPNLYLDKIFLDTLIGNIGSPDPFRILNLILLIVAARFGLAAVRTLSTRVAGYFSRIIFWKNNQRLEILIGKKYASISVPVLESPEFKNRYNRIERESLNRFHRVTENVVRIPQHISAIVSSLSFFVITQPFVIVFSLASLLPSVIVDRIFIKKDYQLDTQIAVLHRTRGFYYSQLARNRSYMEIRLLGIADYLAGHIIRIWNDIIAKRLAMFRSWRTWSFLAGLVDDITSYSFDALFAYQAIIQQITIGTAQAYIRAISSFKRSVSDLTAATMELYENYFYLNDLVWFLNLDEPYFNSNGHLVTAPLNQGFEFKNVWFKYPETDNWILKGISFKVDFNENIAIVGKNGAGKTTLVKLLCGFYSPTKGQVLVGGRPVSGLNKPSYWKKLSVLFQDFDQFGLSATERIGISDLNRMSDPDQIIHFSKLVGIHDWIKGLPKGYENPLSRDFEHGIMPSTGQAQRVGIARTLFRKDADLLILDEPTSNVDPESEEQIFEEIIKLGLKKNLIFISHRFSTVRKADRILLVEDGQITENGSHEKLMAENGTYARLFSLQAKSYQ
ncbi:hypothetical protein A2397_05370 [Candidatus Amesbacteria bacterium RIFOXYB1_FULL_44_23]|uniref:ABC transporter domain-containing protein n=1 Tax=Candidatus Amesbacteria bacterium RIFOXYB1_FULL_44_23 TaxID=1797263 RepID=A0A1F4ZR62_9BACT|nr:MAG: hypothetical protein A2397_05370 [Candidatus Amesbacteria bacterium RIFOXYB1_FULL_44_23]